MSKNNLPTDKLNKPTAARKDSPSLSSKKFSENARRKVPAYQSSVTNSANRPIDEEIDLKVKVAIVGAGIAGLYCCHHLFEASNTNAYDAATIGVFESSDRLGGRIETWRIFPKDFDQTYDLPLVVNEKTERIRFEKKQLSKDLERLGRMIANEDKNVKEEMKQMLVAEFGPMRIEPEHQPLLDKLLNDLGIKGNDSENLKWSDLVPFSPYAGEPPNEPEFHLEGEEAEQETMLDLLLLGFRRIFEIISFDKSWSLGEERYEELDYFWKEMTDAGYLHRTYWKRHMRDWINCLRDEHYDVIREHFKFKGTPLRDMGFWNIIASVLSHMATVKLRDWGSFYHLLNDNPNAAEWLIFWLRAIRSTNSLVGIRGGMDWIVIKLCKKLGMEFWKASWSTQKYRKEVKDIKDKTKRKYPKLHLYCNTALSKVEEKEDCVILNFNQGEGKTFRVKAEQVILSLPKSPLENIVFENDRGDAQEWNLTFKALLDTVSPIPLLKCFIVVDKPFWEDDRPANRYAYTIPTREVHYWKTEDKSKGLLMMYTDRPGTEYWSNYLLESIPRIEVAPGFEINRRWQEEAKRFFWTNVPTSGKWVYQKFGNDRLLRTFFAYVRENHAESVPDNQVLAAGIRDWGLKPYEGAAHAWRPGSNSRSVIKYFKAFSTIEGKSAKDYRLHICGEAYSDYQGFIEGALRSAREVLRSEPFNITDEKKFIDTEKELILCRTRKPVK